MLPIGKAELFQCYLVRSFISAERWRLIPILIVFNPASFPDYSTHPHGTSGAVFWIGSITDEQSWTLIGFMLWFNKAALRKEWLIGLVVVFCSFGLGLGRATWLVSLRWNWPKPMFWIWHWTSPVPIVKIPHIMAAAMIGCFPQLCRRFLFGQCLFRRFSCWRWDSLCGQSNGFFSRFGLAGSWRNLEWKLINSS